MKIQFTTVFHFWALMLLWLASQLVPRKQRNEWHQEWRSELWHVRRECAPEKGISWHAEQEVVSFCLGAFEDARCLRTQSKSRTVPLATTKGSAGQCVRHLATAAIVSFAVALFFPSVRRELQPSPYRDAQNLVLIRAANYATDSVPTIPSEQFLAWAKRPQQVFDNFAFYRVETDTLFRPSQKETKIGVASGTSNLFELLGLTIRFAPSGTNTHGAPRLVLSDETWKKEFGGDIHIAGRKVWLGHEQVVIAGVVPKTSWRLPGNVDAWMLLPDDEISSLGRGFVIAHLNPGSNRSGRWDLFIPAPLKQSTWASYFLCTSLSWRAGAPLHIFLFAVLLACLSLPATTSLPLGEYHVTSGILPWQIRLRRWAFLVTKICLVLPVVFFVPINLAYLGSPMTLFPPEAIQVFTSFLICLFGLRWVVRDQRQRCPICLGKLTHPARVGEPSRNFLAWNGTELICAGGHGLLHIPEIATSWFGVQRWLYLDPSWESLFAETG